jgi:hypothetical protein
MFRLGVRDRRLRLPVKVGPGTWHKFKSCRRFKSEAAAAAATDSRHHPSHLSACHRAILAGPAQDGARVCMPLRNTRRPCAGLGPSLHAIGQYSQALRRTGPESACHQAILADPAQDGAQVGMPSGNTRRPCAGRGPAGPVLRLRRAHSQVMPPAGTLSVHSPTVQMG